MGARAKVRWHGSEFEAELIGPSGPEGYLMRALAKGARWEAGTTILVQSDEITWIDPPPAFDEPAPESPPPKPSHAPA